MRPTLKALALSTFCLTAASCGEPQRVVQALPTPPERLVCDKLPPRPSLPPEYKIDWGRVTSVAQARSEHDKFVATLRTRENVITGYIRVIEGVQFVCWNNVEWRRDWEKRTNG